MNNYYETESAAIADLRTRGFNYDFNLGFQNLLCVQTGSTLLPAEFEILETYRFEGDTDPAIESIVFGIQSMDGALKGILVSAYGTYADEVNSSLMEKLK